MWKYQLHKSSRLLSIGKHLWHRSCKKKHKKHKIIYRVTNLVAGLEAGNPLSARAAKDWPGGGMSFLSSWGCRKGICPLLSDAPIPALERPHLKWNWNPQLPTETAQHVSGLNNTQVLCVSMQKSFRERQSDRQEVDILMSFVKGVPWWPSG